VCLQGKTKLIIWHKGFIGRIGSTKGIVGRTCLIVGHLLEWYYCLLKITEREKSTTNSSIESLSTFATVIHATKEECWRLQPERYLRWRRLSRVTVWTFQFINTIWQSELTSNIDCTDYRNVFLLTDATYVVIISQITWASHVYPKSDNVVIQDGRLDTPIILCKVSDAIRPPCQALVYKCKNNIS